MDRHYNLPEMTEKGNQYVFRPVISRDDIISQAIDDCLDVMYRASYPSITLDEYKKQHEEMPEEERKEARLFEAHYLPKNIYDAIVKDFEEAYDFKSPLPDIIEILKDYFKDPIVDKWIEDTEGKPGHRGYDRPEPMDSYTYMKAEKFLDMANGFYKWDRDLNSFLFNVMNFSPCSNRETVEKWHHDNGNPDFKLPDDSWWVDGWDNEDFDNA